jgi:hypothetical protein
MIVKCCPSGGSPILWSPVEQLAGPNKIPATIPEPVSAAPNNGQKERIVNLEFALNLSIILAKTGAKYNHYGESRGSLQGISNQRI